jgi:hypothetical protein
VSRTITWGNEGAALALSGRPELSTKLGVEDLMQFAASRAAAVTTARDVFAPSAKRLTRTSTTVTLIAVALCGLLADRDLLGDANPPPVPAAAQNQVTKVIAPEFCKDQTWPYLDGRCLRRIENPTPLAPPPVRQDVPPSNRAAVTPAPQQNANSAATAPVDKQAAAPASRPDAGKPVIDQVFKRAEPNAAASDAPPYQRTSEAPRHRSRHWGSDYDRSFDARF